MSAGDWRAARIAAELVRNVLAQHDWQTLIREGALSETTGPIFEPTLYRERGRLVREDLEVFRAAARFLSTWGDRPLINAPAELVERAAGIPERAPELAPELATHAAIMRPEPSRRHDAGPDDFDRRIWTWRPQRNARARVFLCSGDEAAIVEGFTVGAEARIAGLPCSLDLFNTILGHCPIVAVPGIQVEIRFAQEVRSCAVGFEVLK